MKNFLAFLPVLLISLYLLACHQDEQKQEKVQTTSTAKKVKKKKTKQKYQVCDPYLKCYKTKFDAYYCQKIWSYNNGGYLYNSIAFSINKKTFLKYQKRCL